MYFFQNFSLLELNAWVSFLPREQEIFYNFVEWYLYIKDSKTQTFTREGKVAVIIHQHSSALSNY